MMRNSIVVLVLAGLLSLPCSAAAAKSPTEQLKGTVDGILELLRDKSLEQEARREQIRALINGRFSFPVMSRSVLAQQWSKASDAEKDRFVELFSGLLENTYMGRIEAYTDEKVEFVGEKLKNDKAEVDTKIVTATVEIPIQYRVFESGGDWFVYDVVIEGVSLVRNYRSSYQEIAKREGYAELFAKMETKLQELKAGRDQK